MKRKLHILHLAFICEFMLLFFFRNRFGFLFGPLLFMATGLVLCIYPWFLLRKYPEMLVGKASPDQRPSARRAWLLFTILSACACLYGAYLFAKYPVDIGKSDIIPFIREIMLKRFLGGEDVYAPVNGFNIYNKPFTPNYLPFHWIPFVLSEALHTDLRWTVLGVFLLALAYYTWNVSRDNNSSTSLLLKTALPFVVLFGIFFKHDFEAANTIELMIAGYYLFLGLSLFSGNAMVRAGGLLLPLMSRYSFLFWLPFHFVAGLRTQARSMIITGGILCALVAAVFVIPFVLRNPSMLTRFNEVYLEGAMQEWDGQDWQRPGDRPFQLFQGIGFAGWFYEFCPGTLMDKITTLKNVLLAVCAGGCILLMLLYNRLKKVVPPAFLSLLALKFSLTLFYSFILVPYVYLFWVPLVVSVIILAKLNENQSAEATI